MEFYDLCIAWLVASTTGVTLTSFLVGMALPICSVTGVLCSTSLNTKMRRVGFSMGILSQPFWYYAAFESYNFGMFINTNFFTIMWLYRLGGEVKKYKKEKFVLLDHV